jgi:hypothetical protein
MVLYNKAAGKGDGGRQEVTLDADFLEVHSRVATKVSNLDFGMWEILEPTLGDTMIASEHLTWSRSQSDGDFGSL